MAFFLEFSQENQDSGGVGVEKSATRSKLSLISEKGSSSYTDYSKSSTTISPGKWYMEIHPDKLSILLGKLFVFAYTWSVGGVLNRFVS